MPRASPGPGPTTLSRRRSSPTRVTFTTTQANDNLAELLNKRQPPSCDACRTRKLKCSGRPQVIELNGDAVATDPCDHCREWSLECSYLYQRKRRGRKNRVVERLADEQRARRLSHGTINGRRAAESEDELELPPGLGNGGVGVRDFAPMAYDPIPPSYPLAVDPSASLSSITHPQWPPSQPIPPPQLAHPSHLPPPLPPQSRPHSQPHPHPHSHQQSHPHPHPQPPPPQPQPSYPPRDFIPSPNSRARQAPPSSVISGPLSGGTGGGGHSAPAQATSWPLSTSPAGNGVSPSVALSEASVPANATLETILSRDLARHIIDLYFEHTYCIIPCIHKPSFMADLLAHEEEKRPMFLALIMAMIAVTLIHIPRTFFPSLPPDGVRRLSDHCLKACYAITRREMDVPTVDLICIKYYAFIVHNKHGNIGLEASAFGEAQYLAISMGLHREDSYPGLNPIEAERRRRVWFLIYNADKFEAIARAKPVLLRSDEFMGPEATDLPVEVDDKSISIHGYLPSSSAVPLISGFNILTRIVTILGDILVHERDIRRRPPKDPEQLLVALKEVRKLQNRVKTITEKLPRPFQLDVVNADALPAPGWEEIMRDQLDLFFSDPMASETAKDGYLVLRANIHVTLAMTRLRLILHREDLINRSGQPGAPARNAAELVAADLGESVDWRHGVYQDLFKAVHGIPIQALAANGPSLVTKIRVVAVTLLDALPAQDYGDANVQGIAAYLLDFLNIMTSIESQFAD